MRADVLAAGHVAVAHKCWLAEVHLLDGHPQSVFVESKYKIEVRMRHALIMPYALIMLSGMYMDSAAR